MRPIRLAPLALAAFAAVAPAPAPAQDKGALAACGDAGQTPERAARFCRRALEAGGLTDRQRALAAFNLGAALLDQGDAAGAVAAYDDAVAAAKDDAWIVAGRARAREAAGDAAGAKADWDRALSLAPQEAGLRAGRGAFRLRADDAGGALADFDAGLARKPGDAGLGYNRALALLGLGRDAEADAALTEVIRRHPKDIGAVLTRGRLRAETDPKAGLADLDAAVKMAGEWPVPVYARARTLDRLGRRAEADRDYRRAWELGMRDEALNARMLEIGR
jgi:tetratricopeptide (TPR) repeat protein